jgi:pilus assembly protein FimV
LFRPSEAVGLVKGLRTENEALAEKLREAERLIAALQLQTAEPSPRKSAATAAATAGSSPSDSGGSSSGLAAVDGGVGSGAPSSSSSSSSGGGAAADAEAQAAAHAVGARVRALQATIAAQDSKDPTVAARFLHQPRGHRLEPMMGVDARMRPTGDTEATHAAGAAGAAGAAVAPAAAGASAGGGGALASPLSKATMGRQHTPMANPMAFAAGDGSVLASTKAAADAIRAAAKGGSHP